MFDFVFLDVVLPNIDGFEIAQHINEISPETGIIFVTNMASEIHMGYKYNAKDYITKPVTRQQIGQLMDRLLAERSKKTVPQTYTIKLKQGEGKMRLNIADVLYFESAHKYVVANTLHDKYIFRSTLADVQADMQGKGFVRIHKSFLVNKKHVWRCFGSMVKLHNGKELVVSRKYRSDVNGYFNISDMG